jgi:hypothetical protein
MLRRRSRLFPLALLALATGLSFGCAAPTYQNVPRADAVSEMPAEGMYRIFAFRSGQFAGAVRSVEVRIADREIGAMGSSGYICWDRAPGRAIAQVIYHGPKIDGKPVEGVFEVDGKAGEIHYVEMHLTERDKRPEFRTLSAAEGRAAVGDRKPADER